MIDAATMNDELKTEGFIFINRTYAKATSEVASSLK
jgi:hypothetical protein